MDQSGAGHWKASARAAGLAPLFTQPSIEIWSSELTSVALGPGGLILGSIFADNGTTDREWLQGSARRIAESRGSELLSRWWGSFVAFLVGDGCCDIIRAPFGTLPVLYARGGGQLFVASDVELLRACGYSATVIDWTELARHLTAGEIRRSATCLADVSELRGGMRLTVSAETVSVSELWTPWRAAARARCPEPVDRSQRLLVSTVDRCTAAIAKSVRRPLLLLSGGLDSSILAASLAHSDQIFSALTFTTTEPAGDERRYARAVAGALTFDLIEAERRLDNVDVTRSDSARLPRPARRSFLQDSRKLTEEVGAACDADLVLEGGGGDNVFCLLQSVTPVVDRLLAGEGWRAAFASARDVAELTEATALEVCARALHRAVLRRSAIRTPLDRSFLTAAAAEAARDASHHPWLVPPLGAWPGSAAHIALLVAAQSWSESFDPLAAIATECPLLARPVVEACLAVPSWRWFDRGQNRVVAREAFRSRLPALVVDRRSKATPDSFVTRLYERNRGIIRELLLDGKLAANGLLDRDALDKALSIMGPQRDHDHRRIMRIADAEAWARAQVR
jgi:asparagine synthase (glutamine-hydrolysing)